MNKSKEYNKIKDIVHNKANQFFLHLNYMCLQALPLMIFEMTDLIRLDISHNDIDILPNEIGNLINLQYLWLNHNPIKLIPGTINQCKSLIYLDVRNTSLRTLPSELANIKTLINISCDNNDWDRSLIKPITLGTQTLLKYLKSRNFKDTFEKELFRKLKNTIYFRNSLNPSGLKKINNVVKLSSNIFPSEKDMSSILKLYDVVFPHAIDDVDEEYLKGKLDRIRTDIKIKQQLVKIEIKLRNHYFNKCSSDVIDRYVHLLMLENLDLYTITFMCDYFKQIYPPNPDDLNLKEILKVTGSNIDSFKLEREKYRQNIFESLKKIYTTQEDHVLQQLTFNLIKYIKKNEELKRFISLVPDYFTAEFDLIDPKDIAKKYIKDIQI